MYYGITYMIIKCEPHTYVLKVLSVLILSLLIGDLVEMYSVHVHVSMSISCIYSKQYSFHSFV